MRKSSSVERDEFSVVAWRLTGIQQSGWGGGGGSFHRPGTVKENVLESDFEPLCDGTTRRRSLADLRLLKGMFVDNPDILYYLLYYFSLIMVLKSILKVII